MSVRDVAATVRFIGELDPQVNLEDLLSESIDLFASRVDRIDRRDLIMLRMDPEVISKIEEKLASKTKDYSIKELFVALAGSNSWNPSDVKHLLGFTEKDFFAWITEEQSANVVGLVKEFLQRFGDKDGEAKDVVERIRGALEKVKDRSNLDRCRVEYLIEDKETNEGRQE